MSDLREALVALTQAAAEVPGQLGELLRGAEEMEGESQALLDAVAETTRNAEETLARELEGVLDRLRTVGEDSAARLQSATAEAEAEAERTAQQLQTGLARLQPAADDVRTRFEALDHALEEGALEVQAAADVAAAEAADAGQRLREAQAELQAAADAGLGGLTAMKERVADARAGAHESVGVLETQLVSHRAAVESSLARLDAQLERFTTETRLRSARLADDIASQAEEIGRAASGELDGSVRSVVEQGTDTVREGVEQMARLIVSGKDEASASAQALEPLFRQLEDLIGPVRDALDDLREAAAKVGHAF